MKVILIQIYGGAEEEEMVHVSVVSGTPPGPRDMTAISQISDRRRDGGPVGPRRSHSLPSERTGGQSELLNTIYTSLSLQSVNSPQDLTFVRRREKEQEQISRIFVVFFLLFFRRGRFLLTPNLYRREYRDPH